MEKRVVLGLLLLATLFTTPAFAQVANTSQKGSVLIFPLIDIRNDDGTTTVIHISNDNNSELSVQCYYINEAKDRRDFRFQVTKKQPVSWDVKSGKGTIFAPQFPGGVKVPGFGFRTDIGELICFAVNDAGSNPIVWNHLSGNATVVYSNDPDAGTGGQSKQAFEYNAWSFRALFNPVLGTPLDPPSPIHFDGISYDAFPLYLVANFSPNGATFATGSGPLYYLDNNLSVSSCQQDLRQDFDAHYTKLVFEVWNEQETKFTGSYKCADSVQELGLALDDQPLPPALPLVAPENFSFAVLGSTNARFQVSGINSNQCPFKTEDTGLVGVLNTSLGIGVSDESAEIGTTLHTAGKALGPCNLWWDPQPPNVPDRRQ
jgi:hypothetical protein